MTTGRIMVLKNNYLTQLQIKWSLDQTRDIAQCKTITKNPIQNNAPEQILNIICTAQPSTSTTSDTV